MSAVEYPHFVTARINDIVKPIARGERYEDPLDALLKEKKIGEVTGGGSQLDKSFGIVYIEVEVSLKNLDEALDLTAAELEKYGAPKGSKFMYKRDGVEETRPFGTYERLILSLDGVNLPPEVYTKENVDSFYTELDKILATSRTGSISGDKSHGDFLELWIFGPSAPKIQEVITPLVTTHTMAQNHKIDIGS